MFYILEFEVQTKEFFTNKMSCIKFPSSKSDLLKPSNKENAIDYNKANSALISAANEVFGDGKWSHSINNQCLDYIDFVGGRYQAGCSSIVRVQLHNGSFHENVGYSCTEGSSKGSAIQKARLGSCNTALKKALMCFGKDITNKINKTLSRPSSPIPVEAAQSLPIPNNSLQVQVEENIQMEFQRTAETFEDCIPMSQAEALMDLGAFDQIFDKNSNNLDVAKTEKDEKTSTSNGISMESQTSVAKPIAPTVSISNALKKDCKIIIGCTPKTETKVEVAKSVVSTAMTEEEIRLERKRKQREMQEEFKRKEESKKKMVDNRSKLPPNPRY